MKKNKKVFKFILCFLISILVVTVLSLIILKYANKKPIYLKYYDISNIETQDPILREISKNSIIDDKGSKKGKFPYLAHPDILAIEKSKNETEILNFYVDGHGIGPTKLKRATFKDNMKTSDLVWQSIELNQDFKKTEETPTLFTLNFKNKEVKYLYVSGRPGWSNMNNKGQGFYASLSKDGINWENLENFYGEDAKREKYKYKKGIYNPIVAMSSMIQVRENNEFVDKWDFLFHDYTFRIFKTTLSFNENGEMEFSKPEAFMQEYEDKYQKKYHFCEPYIFRNKKNLDQIIVLFRSNKKISNSYIAVSNDNGKTYQTPKELPSYLTGERHKLTYLDDEKVAISFRDICFYNDRKSPNNFYSHGTMMWVGKLEDLLLLSNEDKGILLKVFHTYLDFDKYSFNSNPDTGYCGLYSKRDENNDLIILISSYGKMLKEDKNNTVIASKIINISEIERMIKMQKIKPLTK